MLDLVTLPERGPRHRLVDATPAMSTAAVRRLLADVRNDPTAAKLHGTSKTRARAACPWCSVVAYGTPATFFDLFFTDCGASTSGRNGH